MPWHQHHNEKTVNLKTSRRREGGKRFQRDNKSEPEVDESSPVIELFREFSKRLDTKHDKHECLVKLSRDITIESKRIIFLLHRMASGDDQTNATVIKEAEIRLTELENTLLKKVAVELTGEDPFQYLRAYTAGIQEYIEALSYFFYVKDQRLIPWAEVQQRLSFSKDKPLSGTKDAEEISTGDSFEHTVTEISQDSSKEIIEQLDAEKSVEDAIKKTDSPTKKIDITEDVLSSGNLVDCDTVCLLIPQSEYILGLADLTGELMRKCITTVSSGQFNVCFQLCEVLRHMYEGFTQVGNSGPREVSKKVTVLKQSLRKVEWACYTLQVRGSEIPKHSLAGLFSVTRREEEDVDTF